MKKITIAILVILGTMSMASAELGISVGLTGTTGVFHATGVDEEGVAGDVETHTEDATGVVGYGSVFLEKNLGRFIVGYSWVLDDLASETNETVVQDTQNADLQANPNDNPLTNKVKVTFSDMQSLYAALMVTENMYVKYSMNSVDLITGESLGTGSTYANASIDGTSYGAGYKKSFDSGLFFGFEGMLLEWDNTSLTAQNNTDNKITMKDFEGFTASFAVGKTF